MEAAAIALIALAVLCLLGYAGLVLSFMEWKR